MNITYNTLKPAFKFLPVSCFFLLAALLSPPLRAQYLNIGSNFIQIYADSSTSKFGIGTAATYTPADATLTFNFDVPWSSTITPMVNGVATDFANAILTSPMVAVGSGLGAYLESTGSLSNGVLLTAHYEIVNNPVTGNLPDTAMLKFTYTNTGSASVIVGLRVMIDTEVNSNDGADISINNGISTVATDTLYLKNNNAIPPEWWDYDSPPPSTPNLIGHGAVYNNPNDLPATEPDAYEIALWPTVYGTAVWAPGTPGASISDSAVVFWWTGTGDDNPGTIPLSPAQSITFITYYGLSQLALLTTPTITPTVLTATPTPSPTPTPSITPTPTMTLSPTITITPTITLTPTITQTFTSTSTPTSTASFTPTNTSTSTFSPTITQTDTITLTPTITNTPTITLTPTVTVTPTITPFGLHLWPNPYDPKYAFNGTLNVYEAPAGSSLCIYTVSGELVASKLVNDNNWIYWDGRNRFGVPVSAGIYFYIIKTGSAVLMQGTLLVLRN